MRKFHREAPVESMTVGQLKELLSSFTDDTEVMFSYNFGDYWRTQVAGTIGTAELKDVVYSEYHSMNKIRQVDEIDEDDEEDEDVEDRRRVVILN